MITISRLVYSICKYTKIPVRKVLKCFQRKQCVMVHSGDKANVQCNRCMFKISRITAVSELPSHKISKINPQTARVSSPSLNYLPIQSRVQARQTIQHDLSMV